MVNANEELRVISVQAAGSDELQIHFDGDSWVEIDDGNDTTLYRDMRLAGDLLELKGQAPFNVLLGNAVAVTVSFNGREIDISDDIRIDNSARLVLGL